MARRKVRLADNIARVVEIDDAATVGATLARDLKGQDGKKVLTPEALRTWLNVEEKKAATTSFATVRAATPLSSSAPGTAGQVSYDSSYLYICTAPNTWGRIAIASF
jgi:hypothetical protein